MSDLPTVPFDNPTLLGMAPRMRELQSTSPITRVRTPAGDEAWLVTRYDDVKALFGDGRLGRSHPNPERAARITNSALIGGATANYDSEDVDHATMRSRLVPCFSARRMKALKPRVEELVEELLDDLEGRTTPADLHKALSFPLPVLVICELLGVPYADREQFHEWSTQMADLHDTQRSAEALQTMIDYMRKLVGRKRTESGNDIISELILAEGGNLTDDDIAGLAAVVLFAGHETTVVRIDIGAVFMLASPRQREALSADETRVPSAVEEILRMGVSVNGGGGLPRYARADIEIGGVTIRTGEAVMLSLGAANLDERAFADPDQFDITRRANPHVTFGHGARYCIGAALARIELTAVFERLFQRFPTMELAVPIEALRWRKHLLTGGFAELPITW